eukprot:TRINITY_DN591_c0_g1_i2.p1 TRINITY_DN591_c0_g1~~TRINITY_DN591_c0_g1_i2.p1  ORF type:complete len:110 (+),score=10.66 TRINITY_DN591_c0_g1_i2:62-391(+)
MYLSTQRAMHERSEASILPAGSAMHLSQQMFVSFSSNCATRMRCSCNSAKRWISLACCALSSVSKPSLLAPFPLLPPLTFAPRKDILLLLILLFAFDFAFALVKITLIR